MEENEYHKCNKEQGFCPTLRARVKSSGEPGYGMFKLAVLDLFENTGSKNAVRVIGVNYKESAKDRGVMFNYCPYCGEKIDWFREGREEKEELTTSST